MCLLLFQFLSCFCIIFYLCARYCICVCVSVCLCVCLSVRTKFRKLLSLNKNWNNLVGICLLVNISWWILEVHGWNWWHSIFSYFRIFSAQATPFERLYIATSFSVWRYIFRTSRSRSVSRLLVQCQDHSSEKAVACNSKTNGQKLLGLDRNICYDSARSNSELLTFWPWHLKAYFRIFWIKL